MYVLCAIIQTFYCPGAHSFEIEFDERCKTERWLDIKFDYQLYFKDLNYDLIIRYFKDFLAIFY